MSANEYLRRAVALAQGGDLKAALLEVKGALRVAPDDEKALVFRFTLEARLLRRARRFDEAAVRYHAVLALDADNQEARTMLRQQAEGFPSDPAEVEAPSDAVARASERPTLPPSPATVASSDGPSFANLPANSSAPPMMDVVSPRGLRRTKAPGSPSLPSSRKTSGPAPSPPTVSSALISASASAQPLVTPIDVPSETPHGEDSDAMTEQLPPRSVDKPLETERRVAPRVAIEVDVGVSSESNFFTGFSGDISEGGLFIATYNLVAVGSHVHVSFGVMGREISCDATVCWIRDPVDVNLMPGFGVRFGELSEPDHAAILKFIHTRAPMFYDDEDD